MTVAVDDANNILQIGSVMKYEQPRKSPSFNVKGTVFIDNVSTAVTNYVAKVVFHSKSKLSTVFGRQRGRVPYRVRGQDPVVYGLQSPVVSLSFVQDLNTGLLFIYKLPMAHFFPTKIF